MGFSVPYSAVLLMKGVQFIPTHTVCRGRRQSNHTPSENRTLPMGSHPRIGIGKSKVFESTTSVHTQLVTDEKLLASRFVVDDADNKGINTLIQGALVTIAMNGAVSAGLGAHPLILARGLPFRRHDPFLRLSTHAQCPSSRE